MVGGRRIIAFESGSQEAAGDEMLLTDEVISHRAEPDEPLDEAAEEPAPSPRRAWLPPALALVLAALWTAFFIWAHRAAPNASREPAAWTALIADWAGPVLLIGVVWLIAMRSSRREAMRFGDTARVLSDESARLEGRLLTINRELSLAREFIAAQARDLDTLGRLATERLSQNADRLQSLIHDNGARIDSIGSVSEAALDNMEKLRGQLPVIASSAKDVTNNIGNAGRTANGQLDELIRGFRRLNEFGEASERQVVSLRAKVDEALAEFARQTTQLDEVAGNRFAALAERGAEFRGQLDAHEIAALAAIRTRAAALAEEVAQTRHDLDSQEESSLTSLRARLSAMRDEGSAISRAIRDGEARSLESWRAAVAQIDADLRSATAALEGVESQAVRNARARLAALSAEAAEIEAHLADRDRDFADAVAQRRALFEDAEDAAITRLSERIAALDAEIAERRAGHEAQSAALAAHGEAIAMRLGEFEARLREIARHGGEAEANFAATVDTLSQRLGESRALLTGTDREIDRLTDAAVRLLEILQASKQQSRDELPDALAASETQLAAFESRIAALRQTAAEASSHGEALSGAIAASEAGLRERFAEIAELQATLGNNGTMHGAMLDGLRQALEDMEQRSGHLADKAQGELSEAIAKLLAATREAMATIGESGSRSVALLAGQLGEESSAAIDKAVRASAAEAAGQIEMAAAHAAGVSREAVVQLRDQLGKVNELVGNLERRVAHARQRAEEQVDNDFSRRAALITESLNSNAIDIARALSADISDTSWAAYLRGDRGIFTRRAVSLLENGETKAIAQVYEQDAMFREHVSRYIHDFEAILRQVLSTRDGQALGVTLLSSDMGKLYVALAQAIERFRS